MTREEAIEYWERFNAEIDDLCDTCSDAERDILVKQREVVEFTISALRAQQERENPEPLTLDELREMRYGWVWAISNDPDLTVSGWAYIAETRAITIWEYKPDSIVGNVQLRWEDYGKTWIAYRNKPEEGHKGGREL